MSTGQLIGKAAETTKQVLAGVSPSQYKDPTPCNEFNVKQLSGHMAGLLIGAELAANKQKRQGSPDEMPDLLGDNPGPAYAALAEKAVAAWSQPGAFEGMCEFGPGEMPAQMAGAITLMEIAVHGWDLAAATGQSYQMDPEVAEATWQTLQQIASPESRARGTFGPEVSVPAEASLQDRLLAFSGRDPNWKA